MNILFVFGLPERFMLESGLFITHGQHLNGGQDESIYFAEDVEYSDIDQLPEGFPANVKSVTVLQHTTSDAKKSQLTWLRHRLQGVPVRPAGGFHHDKHDDCYGEIVALFRDKKLDDVLSFVSRFQRLNVFQLLDEIAARHAIYLISGDDTKKEAKRRRDQSCSEAAVYGINIKVRWSDESFIEKLGEIATDFC